MKKIVATVLDLVLVAILANGRETLETCDLSLNQNKETVMMFSLFKILKSNS